MSDFRIVIPARYESGRFPGKPLIQLAGRPMLAHVWACACKTGARDVVIATDDKRIFDAASAWDADVCMTSADHQTGTDRIAEVAAARHWSGDDIVVNLQGDEPLMPAAAIEQVARLLARYPDASIATLFSPIQDEQAFVDPARVKLVLDERGYAIYFSRAAVPHVRDPSPEDTAPLGLHHIGLYAYRVSFLADYSSLEQPLAERREKLEQLRALLHGYRICAEEAVELPGPDVNTPDDVRKVEAFLLNLESGS